MYLIPSFRTITTNDISEQAYVFQVDHSSQLESDSIVFLHGIGLLTSRDDGKCSISWPSVYQLNPETMSKIS